MGAQTPFKPVLAARLEGCCRQSPPRVRSHVIDELSHRADDRWEA